MDVPKFFQGDSNFGSYITLHTIEDPWKGVGRVWDFLRRSKQYLRYDISIKMSPGNIDNLFGFLFKFTSMSSEEISEKCNIFLQTYPTEIESKISHEMILSKEIPLIKKGI